jgi:spermidine dehydrogenase
LSDEAADTFQGRPHDFFAMGIDAISAIDAMETGYPGFAGVGLSAGRESAAEMVDPYMFHFPDGNATIARLLVRSLIPAVYAYSGDPVFDPQDDARRPWETARARVGRVAFANADAAWEPFAHVAIEEGHRAASELLG